MKQSLPNARLAAWMAMLLALLVSGCSTANPAGLRPPEGHGSVALVRGSLSISAEAPAPDVLMPPGAVAAKGASGVAVGLVAGLLFSAVEEAVNRMERTFFAAVNADRQQVDLFALMEQDFRARVEQQRGRYEPVPPAASAAAPAADALRVKADLKLFGVSSSLAPSASFMPHVQAVLTFTRGSQVVAKQTVVFLGSRLEGGDRTAQKLADWWGQGERYKNFLIHAARALALNMAFTLYDDPTLASAAAYERSRGQAYAIRSHYLDAPECAFSTAQALGPYRLQKYQGRVLLAPTCGPPEPVPEDHQDITFWLPAAAPH